MLSLSFLSYHQFSFVFVPKNAKESKQVADLIKTLKRLEMPKDTPIDINTEAYQQTDTTSLFKKTIQVGFLQFPYEFQLSFWAKDLDNNNL